MLTHSLTSPCAPCPKLLTKRYWLKYVAPLLSISNARCYVSRVDVQLPKLAREFRTISAIPGCDAKKYSTYSFTTSTYGVTRRVDSPKPPSWRLNRLAGSDWSVLKGVSGNALGSPLFMVWCFSLQAVRGVRNPLTDSDPSWGVDPTSQKSLRLEVAKVLVRAILRFRGQFNLGMDVGWYGPHSKGLVLVPYELTSAEKYMKWCRWKAFK